MKSNRVLGLTKISAAILLTLSCFGAYAQDNIKRTLVPLTNASFEEKDEKGKPKGWTSEEGSPSYVFTLDMNEKQEGNQSLKIQSQDAQSQEGIVWQTLPGAQFRGKTLELSAWVKTENVDGNGAVLTLRSLGNDRVLAYNFMRSTPVRGTTGWQKYSIPLKISKKATDIEIGVMLHSQGTVWVDSVMLNVIER